MNKWISIEGLFIAIIDILTFFFFWFLLTSIGLFFITIIIAYIIIAIQYPILSLIYIVEFLMKIIIAIIIGFLSAGLYIIISDYYLEAKNKLKKRK